jgi:hypothetical protein
VVQRIHDDPPRYQQVPGTVLAADPCVVADKQAVETALGQTAFVEAKGLHQCDFWSGDSTNYPQVSVHFFPGLPPEAEDGKPADLGGGVRAVQEKDEDSDLDLVGCEVSWRKLETPRDDEADGYGEFVSAQFSGRPASGLDTNAACTKAVAVAKTVVPSLDQK